MNFSGKDLLADALRLLNLGHAEYSSKVDGNGLFVGKCKFFVGRCKGRTSTGRTVVEGRAKSTPAEAEGSAASNALALLERLRGMEVIDLNYAKYQEQKNKVVRAGQLRALYNELVANADSDWSGLIESVGSIVAEQHLVTESVAMSSFVSSVALARKLEVTVAKITDLHQSGLAAIASTSE